MWHFGHCHCHATLPKGKCDIKSSLFPCFVTFRANLTLKNAISCATLHQTTFSIVYPANFTPPTLHHFTSLYNSLQRIINVAPTSCRRACQGLAVPGSAIIVITFSGVLASFECSIVLAVSHCQLPLLNCFLCFDRPRIDTRALKI